MNLRTSIKPLTAAVASAIVFTAMSSNVNAVCEPGVLPCVEPAYQIKPDYIGFDVPVDPNNIMQAWLDAAETYALNPVNLRAGTHPDRGDPEGGPYGVVYIFPDEQSANDWWDPTDPAQPGPPQDGVPDEAVALIHWELDNGSGSFPGIMAKNDDPDFKSRNCIMAAGDEIPVSGGGVEPKTCGNPQGASKRFKLNVLKHGVPVDLVYNVEPADLEWANYDSLPVFDEIGDDPDVGTVEEAGRIYRILQKFHNTTGMDAITREGTVIPRSGERMAGFRLELGYGVGTAFEPIPEATISNGLEPDKTLGWELRPCLPDHFLDVSRDNPGSGANPCTDLTDGSDQEVPQELWLEEEYASFSPKNYATRNDKRLLGIGVPGGFWDKAPSGMYPPEIQLLGRLDSGYAPAGDFDVYWDSRVDDPNLILQPDPEDKYYGATVHNYFDVTSTTASHLPGETFDPNIQDPNYRIGVSADEYNTGIIAPPFPFGYLMHYGVLSDDTYGPYGDVENAPLRLVADDDGLPSTEGDMIAWWDGSAPDCCFRWGVDGPVFDGVVEAENAFSKVDPDLVKEWALNPLVEDCEVDGSCPPGPLYEINVLDDLVGLNVDSFVYLGRNFETEYNDPVDPKRSFTVRLTTVSVYSDNPYGDGTASDFPLASTDVGVEDGPWVANPPPALESFLDGDGIVVISEPAIVGAPLEITVGDTNACEPVAVTVSAVYPPTGVSETETVDMTEVLEGIKYVGSLPTTEVVPTVGTLEVVSGNGTLEVFAGTEVTATYVDCLTEAGDGPVDRTDTVVMEGPEGEEVPEVPTVPVSSESSDSFCAYNPNGRFDPVLPALVLIGLGYLGLRRKNLTSE